jgi:hypothetical protein
MFKRPTLFVLGAGSSAEVGLPLGTQLAGIIGKKTDIRFGDFGKKHIGSGDAELFAQVIHRYRQEESAYQQAAWLIRDGISLARSIDDFLDLHRSNAYVNRYGKAAIVRAILEAERQSKLYFASETGLNTFDPNEVAHTWLVKFMHMLSPGIPKENVRRIFDNVSFIVFNYDRCLEHFLSNALQKLYGIREEEAVEIVRGLHILHPYGVVGDAPFGSGRADYFALADAIKTYTEQIDAAEIIAKLVAAVEQAECIVFLGFAFNSQNMQMLRPPKRPDRHKFIYGTAYKMSDADVEVVSSQIATFFEPVMDSRARTRFINIENKLRSTDLFDNYAKSLTGGD